MIRLTIVDFPAPLCPTSAIFSLDEILNETFFKTCSEPSYWNYNYGDEDYAWGFWNYFGTYGIVKHQFLIEQNGEKWDDDYIKSLMDGDSAYLTFLAQKMAQRLEEVNAERAAQGEGPLCEADGTPVSFE